MHRRLFRASLVCPNQSSWLNDIRQAIDLPRTQHHDCFRFTLLAKRTFSLKGSDGTLVKMGQYLNLLVRNKPMISQKMAPVIKNQSSFVQGKSSVRQTFSVLRGFRRFQPTYSAIFWTDGCLSHKKERFIRFFDVTLTGKFFQVT